MPLAYRGPNINQPQRGLVRILNRPSTTCEQVGLAHTSPPPGQSAGDQLPTSAPRFEQLCVEKLCIALRLSQVRRELLNDVVGTRIYQIDIPRWSVEIDARDKLGYVAR
jgi:hypothetical protein